jgi:RNA polymerase sigma-70 factor (ECF subfamily)
MDHFVTTQWGLVLEAQGPSTGGAHEALSSLCDLYWYPLYAYLRRHGHDRSGAEDLTQGFFAFLLEHETLQRADPARGRFRSFLLVSFKHYVANARDHAQAQKRGGTIRHVPLDQDAADARYRAEPIDGWTPERAFDRNWALTVVSHALQRVQRACDKEGKRELWRHLQPALTGEPLGRSYRDIGVALNMSEGAVKQAAHRLRTTFRTMLYEEISTTVATPADVDAELQYLMTTLAS